MGDFAGKLRGRSCHDPSRRGQVRQVLKAAPVKIKNAAPRLLDHECRGQETLRRESTTHIEVRIQGTAGNQR